MIEFSIQFNPSFRRMGSGRAILSNWKIKFLLSKVWGDIENWVKDYDEKV